MLQYSGCSKVMSISKLVPLAVSSSCSKVMSISKHHDPRRLSPLLQNFYLHAACLPKSGGVQSESRLLDMENPAEKSCFEIARPFFVGYRQ